MEKLRNDELKVVTTKMVNQAFHVWKETKPKENDHDKDPFQ